MKKLSFFALVCQMLLLVSCGQPKEKTASDSSIESENLPRIAIAGIAIESSTFSPARTLEEAFHARSGDAVLDYYPFMAKDSMDRNRAIWFPTIQGMLCQEEL